MNKECNYNDGNCKKLGVYVSENGFDSPWIAVSLSPSLWW